MVIFIKRRKRTNETLFWWLGAARRRVKGKRGMSNETHWTVPPPTRAPPPPPLLPQINANARASGRSRCGHAIIGTSNTRFRVRWTSKRSQGTILYSAESTTSASSLPQPRISGIRSRKTIHKLVPTFQHAKLPPTSNDKISFLGKFALAGSCDPISRLPVYVHVSQNEWNSLENSDVSNVSYSG